MVIISIVYALINMWVSCFCLAWSVVHQLPFNNNNNNTNNENTTNAKQNAIIYPKERLYFIKNGFILSFTLVPPVRIELFA